MAGSLTVRELITKFGFEVDESKIAGLDRAVGDIKNKLNGATLNLKQFADGITAAGTRLTAFVTLPIVAAGAASIKAASDIEQMGIAFETMTGSAEVARSLIEDLLQFTARTPFQLPEVRQNAQLLLGMGFAAQEIIPQLTNLGNVASGLGVPLNRIALNFGQVRVQGKLTGRELRDFAVQGVPLISELSRMLGVSESAIADMVSAGEIGFDKVNQAFKNMSSEGGRFFNLMQKQSLSLGGLFTTLVDSIRLVAVEIGQMIVEEFDLKRVVADLIKSLASWRKRLDEISPRMRKLILLIVGFAAALGPVLLGVGTLLKAFLAIKVLAIVLGSALAPMIGQFLLIAAAIAAVVAVVGLIIQDFIVWKNGGNSLIGSLLGDFEKFRFVFVGVWNAIKTTFVSAWRFMVNAARSILTPFVESIKTMFGGVLQFLGGFFQVFGGLLSGDLSAIIDGLKNMFEGLITYFKGWGQGLLNLLVLPFKVFWTQVSALFQAAKGGVSGIFKNRKAIGAALGTLGSSLAEGGSGIASTNLGSLARPSVTNNAGTNSVVQNIDVTAQLPPGSTRQQAREVETLTRTGIKAAATQDARRIIQANPVVE